MKRALDPLAICPDGTIMIRSDEEGAAKDLIAAGLLEWDDAWWARATEAGRSAYARASGQVQQVAETKRSGVPRPRGTRSAE